MEYVVIKDKIKFGTKYNVDNTSLLAQLKAAEKYRTYILEGAERFRLQPCVIAGIGSRESHWGLSLTPPGPAGSGDWIKRKGKLPEDGHGWSRGLMSIDYKWHKFAQGEEWKDPRLNILYGCQVLADSLSAIKRMTLNSLGELIIKEFNPDDRTLLRAAIAAYNCGVPKVLTAIRQDVDNNTTGRDYSAEVLNRAGWFQEHGWD